jgi:hypothetical protein
VIACTQVDDRFDAEWLLHSALSDFRVNERREFFAFQREALPWLVSLFANFPNDGCGSFWVDPDKWSAEDLQSSAPWAWDADAACYYIVQMTPHAPIRITEAAELG